MARPAVLFAEDAVLALKRGFDQLANLLALTLGPTQGHILNMRDTGDLEVLTDSATIARRILALPDQAANVGAMLMRNVAWRAHRQAGDGVATTAVLARAILNDAFLYVQAGGNPMMLKRGVDRAARAVIVELSERATAVADEEDLTQVAETITARPELSLVLGEMLDVLGPTAHITVEDYVAPYLERSYYDGGRWVARLESPYLITDQAGRRAVQNDCHVVLYAGRLETGDSIRPLLELLDKLDKRRLLLVAHGVSGEALAALVMNHQQKTMSSIAVSLRRPANRQTEDLADLAVITGANILGEATGRTLSSLEPSDLGHIRRAEATADHLLISGGRGHQAARREKIEQFRARLASLPAPDEERDEVRLRLVRLAGGVGVLKIGAHTKPERDALHQQAEKAIRSLRLALSEGIVPGGGVAYLQTIPILHQLVQRTEGDERYGIEILARALEAPFRQIVLNRGIVSPAAALAGITPSDGYHVYDVLQDSVRPVTEAGLFDPAGVLRTALETAVSGAMLALTTGVVVLHRRPKQSFEP